MNKFAINLIEYLSMNDYKYVICTNNNKSGEGKCFGLVLISKY